MTGQSQGHAHENPHAGQGSVLLDIGGEIGALVVEMPADTVGHEVDIWPVARLGTSYHPAHVAVVARPTPDGPLPTLVFGALPAGDYALCTKGSTDVELRVAVTGGAVEQEVWPRQ